MRNSSAVWCFLVLFAAAVCRAAATAPDLGTAAAFSVLGGSAVTNTGPTIVDGDLGVSPSTSVVGFQGGPGNVVGGTIHIHDAVADRAQTDLTSAYNAAAGQKCSFDLTGVDLGGLKLTPGVYCFDSSAQLTGRLTLLSDDPQAVFIFQMGSSLTTASGSSVVGAPHCNVFWQVGSSATLGTTTSFLGNILALTSITLNTGASVNGRVLARNGAVTMDTNHVGGTDCSLPSPPPPGPSGPPVEPCVCVDAAGVVVANVAGCSGDHVVRNPTGRCVQLSFVNVPGGPCSN